MWSPGLGLLGRTLPVSSLSELSKAVTVLSTRSSLPDPVWPVCHLFSYAHIIHLTLSLSSPLPAHPDWTPCAFPFKSRAKIHIFHEAFPLSFYWYSSASLSLLLSKRRCSQEPLPAHLSHKRHHQTTKSSGGEAQPRPTGAHNLISGSPAVTPRYWESPSLPKTLYRTEFNLSSPKLLSTP